MQILKTILAKLKYAKNSMLVLFKESISAPLYRVVSIEEAEPGDYLATVQMVNTSKVLKMKPEAILGDDKLTDSFSQRDIRTLTYLGYLGINSPKYKILAKRLLEQDKKLVFAIKQKGSKKLLVKTAEEISSNKELIKNLDQQDAHTVGFTSGTQANQSEKELMKKIIDEKKKISKKKNPGGQ